MTNAILCTIYFVTAVISLESNFKVPIFRYFDLRFSRFRKENSTIFQSLTKIDFDFLCSSFLQSNKRSFWCLFAIFYLQHWSASCSKMQKKCVDLEAICIFFLLFTFFSGKWTIWVFISKFDVIPEFEVIFAPPLNSPRNSWFSCLVMW